MSVVTTLVSGVYHLQHMCQLYILKKSYRRQYVKKYFFTKPLKTPGCNTRSSTFELHTAVAEAVHLL